MYHSSSSHLKVFSNFESWSFGGYSQFRQAFPLALTMMSSKHYFAGDIVVFITSTVPSIPGSPISTCLIVFHPSNCVWSASRPFWASAICKCKRYPQAVPSPLWRFFGFGDFSPKNVVLGECTRLKFCLHSFLFDGNQMFQMYWLSA